MSNIVKHTRAYDKDCNGCLRVKRDVMVSFMVVGDDFYDMFLTTEQAEFLVESLKGVLKQNKEYVDNTTI